MTFMRKNPDTLIVHLSGDAWNRIAHLQKVEGKSVVEIIELAVKESVAARSWNDWE